MMAGLLLARQGVEVVVLEKHADFLRDFRGDTIHPSTQQLVHELGWTEEFQRIPHTRMPEVTVAIGDASVTFADFRRLKVHSPYIAFMPQWDFLDFLAGKAAAEPGFELRRSTTATDLITTGSRIVGVRASTPDGPLEVRADLVVAADGRHSATRQLAGLRVDARSAPVDVLWFRLSRCRVSGSRSSGAAREPWSRSTAATTGRSPTPSPPARSPSCSGPASASCAAGSRHWCRCWASG
jgi:2-polyprenyl-6-methoxyphenol hydroxylase-like FAD-dependent oxidoreductase